MLRSLLLTLLCSAAFAVPARPADTADLELVLAVDASSSIDIGEYALQLRGIARGFRDPAVHSAILAGDQGRIAVNVIIWGEQKFSKQSTGWHVISAASEVLAFADLVEMMPRRQFGGTGIGEALDHAVSAIDENAIVARRRVIDVSGDGVETFADGAVLLPEARARAARLEITVNGLAVVNEDRDLPAYFRANLVTGPGAFVLPAADYFDFEQAMREKLLREIGPRARVSALPLQPILAKVFRKQQ